MNRKIWFVVLILLSASSFVQVGPWGVYAAEKPATKAEGKPAGKEEMNLNDAIEMLRTIYQTEYKDLLQSELQLTAEESRSFWPAYNVYRAEMYDVNTWLLGLVEQLAIMEEQKPTSNQDAISLIRQSLDMERKALEIKQRNLDTFSAILSPDKLIRFYQLENKANALVRVRLAEAIPLKSLKK